MQNKKQAFSFVEIIITISIVVLLAVVAISVNQWHKENTYNTKVVSGTDTLNNALVHYLQENSTLPMPKWNTNYFMLDTSYAHSSSGAFWVYGSFTEDIIAKKYLDTLPLDPRTNSYYAYWKTLENVDDLVKNQFEIASVLNIDWEYQAKVTWNYTAEAWPYNLIREYNGSNFVYDKSVSNLPYNPEELILTATASWVVYREWDTITAWTSDLEIYFSDGSVSVLTAWTSITLTELSFPQDNNLTTFVKLTLTTGTIWTKATHLDDNSEFQIYTQDSTAAVRWTIFWVSKDISSTEIIVIEWKVEVTKNDEAKTKIADLIKDESIKVINWEKRSNSTLNSTDFTNIDDNFTTQEDIRWAETMAMINKEIEERIILKNTEINNLDTETSTPWENDNNIIDDETNESENIIEIDDETDTDEICTFIVNWEEMCNDSIWDYSLFAYAPYNISWDVQLYKNWWEIIPNPNENIINWYCWENSESYQCSSNKDTFWANYYNKYHSFVEYTSNKWILISGDWSDDKLKYNLSSIPTSNSDNYIIELSVRAVDLNQIWWRYIFDNQDNKWLYINKISWSNYFQIRYNWSIICYDWWPTLCNFSFAWVTDKTQFETIRVINWNKLEIWWREFTIPWVTTNYLYLGSTKNFNWHFNWIIDYLKIYSN